MAKTPLQLVTPATKKRAVGPLRRPNSDLRSREHLTGTEVDKPIETARSNRHGHRDATMILWPTGPAPRSDYERNRPTAAGATRLECRAALCGRCPACRQRSRCRR